MGPPVAFSGVFLAAISCRLPLNGLQMVRKRLLGKGREDQYPALCGRGFITGWQFMPTENGPGCRRPVGESGCPWSCGCGQRAEEEGHGDKSGCPSSEDFSFFPFRRDKPGKWSSEGTFFFFWCGKPIPSLPPTAPETQIMLQFLFVLRSLSLATV